jgi:hypothetical protein
VSYLEAFPSIFLPFLPFRHYWTLREKNFAQTLEKFFGHRRRLLKKVAQRLAGKALPSSEAAVPRQVENE